MKSISQKAFAHQNTLLHIMQQPSIGDASCYDNIKQLDEDHIACVKSSESFMLSRINHSHTTLLRSRTLTITANPRTNVIQYLVTRCSYLFHTHTHAHIKRIHKQHMGRNHTRHQGRTHSFVERFVCLRMFRENYGASVFASVRCASRTSND